MNEKESNELIKILKELTKNVKDLCVLVKETYLNDLNDNKTIIDTNEFDDLIEEQKKLK